MRNPNHRPIGNAYQR